MCSCGFVWLLDSTWLRKRDNKLKGLSKRMWFQMRLSQESMSINWVLHYGLTGLNMISSLLEEDIALELAGLPKIKFLMFWELFSSFPKKYLLFHGVSTGRTGQRGKTIIQWLFGMDSLDQCKMDQAESMQTGFWIIWNRRMPKNGHYTIWFRAQQAVTPLFENDHSSKFDYNNSLFIASLSSHKKWFSFKAKI